MFQIFLVPKSNKYLIYLFIYLFYFRKLLIKNLSYSVAVVTTGALRPPSIVVFDLVLLFFEMDDVPLIVAGSVSLFVL